MASTNKKDTLKHIVASGDYALAAAGQPLFTSTPIKRNKVKINYNVLPGQLVAYTQSGGTTLTVDDATLAAADLPNLYIGVGIDLNGDGVTDDIRHFGAEFISGCEPREVGVGSPRCGSPVVRDFYFDCTECDATYSVMVKVDDNRTRSYSPFNKSFAEFTGSVVTKCLSCDDCPVEHNCREVACKLADALNGELDLRVGNESYPDWKGEGLPRPFYVTRLHENSYVYCLSPQTVEGACEECTYLNAISGVVINENTHNLVGTTNPADGTQTLKGQLESIVDQLNYLFQQEYGLGVDGANPHAGSAYYTGSYGECCPLQLHINTCDANFALLDDEGEVIDATTSYNPFTTYGTVTDPLNCIDCGEFGAQAQGTLTMTDVITNGETVTIGTKVYTFQDTLTNVDGNVHIGADVEETLDNLRNAINLGPGAGTDYAAAMTLHPTVSGTSSDATTLVVTAKTPGTAGNSIATTETLADGSWGAVVLEGGTAGTINTTTAYPCGIRVIGEKLTPNCDCFIDKPLSFYGRKIEIHPYGEGWKNKPWRVVEVQAMELPSGFGSWIQWLEYQTEPEGRGRRYSRSNINKGWANLPGAKSRIRNATTARCDLDYCSYYIKSLVERKHLSGQYGTSSIHSHVHIPSGDSTTIGAWEDFLDAFVALNPSCRVIDTVACDTQAATCP